MKKLFFMFILFGLFAILAPRDATAKDEVPDCDTIVMTCPDGSQHIVVVCDEYDVRMWFQIYCWPS